MIKEAKQAYLASRKDRYGYAYGPTIEGMNGTWYALAVNSGQEKRIRERILDRLERAKISVPGLSIMAPEEEIVVRVGAQAERKRRMAMPGYLLLYSSREVPKAAFPEIERVRGVLQFLGQDDNPLPLPQSEVEKILGGDTGSPVSQKSSSLFSAGDEVQILDGPMTEFTGTIVQVDETKEEAKIEVEIFGRATKATVPLRSLRLA